MLRRVFAFWLTSVLIVAVVFAWNAWVASNLEPDFGDAFGNFGTILAILAVLTIPVAVCHGIVSRFFRRTLAQASNRSVLILSALAAALFVGFFFLIAPLSLDIPVKPLLLPCALGVLSTLCVYVAAGLVRGRNRVRAA